MKIRKDDYDKELAELQRILKIRKDTINPVLSPQALKLLGLKAYIMATGRREEDHDRCIEIIIGYVGKLCELENTCVKVWRDD